MATTQVALMLIATTLIFLAVFVWSLLYYVPLLLREDDHDNEDDVPTGTRPS